MLELTVTLSPMADSTDVLAGVVTFDGRSLTGHQERYHSLDQALASVCGRSGEIKLTLMPELVRQLWHFEPHDCVANGH